MNFTTKSLAVGLVILLPFVSGCGLIAPLVGSVHSIGVTEGDRQGLLPEELKSFNTALYWGTPQQALSHVLPEGRQTVSEQLRKSRSEERVVDSKVEYVDFADDAYTAKVDVTFKYYKVPFYIVTERKELQTWKFSMNGGWKLESREFKKEG